MNIGVPMGAASGAFALDVDVPKGGDDSLRDLERVHGPLPETVVALTGGGGRHVFFQHPGTAVLNSAGTLGPGLDVRGDGGFVVGVGSRHRSGRTYTWETIAHPDEVALAPAPPWLLARLRERATDRLRADGTPLVLREGERNDGLFRIACMWRRYGVGVDALRGALGAVNQAHCVPPLEAAEVRQIAESAARYAPEDRRVTDPQRDAAADSRLAGQSEPGLDDPGRAERREPWAHALSAPAFLAQLEAQPDWLVDGLLMPGAITRLNSPRGLGKTNVGHAYAVQLAERGKRVLLFDRDNPKSEIRRRLRAWGADTLETLEILSREHAPALTDSRAWKSFPIGTYALVVLDSWDASAEGVGEQDSAKPSKAQAVLLDLAHRENGPAILVLANTTKSGEAGRGAGTLEDREDIVLEVRDATGLTPSGRPDWWNELPDSSRGSWGARAARRAKQERLRLAFTYSKLRVGAEAEPFALEIDFTTAPWSLRLVTAELIAAGQVAATAAAQTAADRVMTAMDQLRQEVETRATAGEEPHPKKEAARFLTARGFTWKRAYEFVEQGIGTHWRFNELTTKRGKPVVLVPLNSPDAHSKSLDPEAPAAQGLQSALSGTPTSGTGVPNRPRAKPRTPRISRDDDLECGRKLRLSAVTIEDVLSIFPGARILEDDGSHPQPADTDKE
jgi:hypothetical protein